MIVVARSDQEKHTMHVFLRERGVYVPACEDFQAFGVVRDERLVAVIALHRFCWRTCAAHIAGDDVLWARRELLRAVYDYLFRQLDLVAVVTTIAANNTRARTQARRLGFDEVHRVRDGFARGVDLIVVELRREKRRHFAKEERHELQAA